MTRDPQDSTGRPIHVGDRVSWCGQIYTIKAFGAPVGRCGTCEITFEESLHVQDEVPDEIGVDLVGVVTSMSTSENNTKTRCPWCKGDCRRWGLETCPFRPRQIPRSREDGTVEEPWRAPHAPQSHNHAYPVSRKGWLMSNVSTTSSGRALVAGHFEEPPFIVPNAKGEAFKIEQVVERGPDCTIKLVWWFLPDDDRHPHNHPWTFDSDILAGGYTSVTYWLVGGQIKTEARIVRAGDRVHYPRHEYHIVKDMLPGTRTRMICGPATSNNAWGYLDPITGREYPWQEQPDTTFMDRMFTLNPWRRSRG